MRKIYFLIIILLIVNSCDEKSEISQEKIDIVKLYYKRYHDKRYNEIEFGFDDDSIFFKNLKPFLSSKFYKKELNAYENIIIPQIPDHRLTFLGSAKILNLIKDGDNIIAEVETLRLEPYLSVNGLSKKYSSDRENFEDITKIEDEINEMNKKGYVTGKGWYPSIKSLEKHIFFFDKNNRIKDIKIIIIKGSLSETYESVINRFIEWNKRFNKINSYLATSYNMV